MGYSRSSGVRAGPASGLGVKDGVPLGPGVCARRVTAGAEGDGARAPSDWQPARQSAARINMSSVFFMIFL